MSAATPKVSMLRETLRRRRWEAAGGAELEGCASSFKRTWPPSRRKFLHVCDASVTLRFPCHAHGHDAGVACAEGGLADKGDLARKSPTTMSLLDPGVSRASASPLYTQVHHWSCSVALRSPPTWLSLMRVRGDGLADKGDNDGKAPTAPSLRAPGVPRRVAQ
eukprot:7388906-Prymnesium_polylepis.1